MTSLDTIRTATHITKISFLLLMSMVDILQGQERARARCALCLLK
jgi:hypothetical protein